MRLLKLTQQVLLVLSRFHQLLFVVLAFLQHRAELPHHVLHALRYSLEVSLQLLVLQIDVAKDAVDFVKFEISLEGWMGFGQLLANILEVGEKNTGVIVLGERDGEIAEVSRGIDQGRLVFLLHSN